MKHPAREEWEKSKDFVDTEIDDVLDHIRDFTRPYKKESGRSSSKATTYSVDIHNINAVRQSIFHNWAKEESNRHCFLMLGIEDYEYIVHRVMG